MRQDGPIYASAFNGLPAGSKLTSMTLGLTVGASASLEAAHAHARWILQLPHAPAIQTTPKSAKRSPCTLEGREAKHHIAGRARKHGLNI